MAKSIEEYTAEVRRASEGSRNALQNQINAIAGNLEQTNKQINENYAQQQANLNNQLNQAAESASMRAAGSGGSFGGAANIANRKYYEQTFVPAQTQLDTNKSQALENAQAQANSNRLTLESQLAALQDQDTKLGLQRYYDEVERERQAELQRQQIAAQRANAAAAIEAARVANQQQNRGQSGMQWDFGNGYAVIGTKGGEAHYLRNGREVTRGEFLYGTGQSGNKWNLWNDIWSNGVKSNGVGSDTIQAFSKTPYTLKGLANQARYSYLFR